VAVAAVLEPGQEGGVALDEAHEFVAGGVGVEMWEVGDGEVGLGNEGVFHTTKVRIFYDVCKCLVGLLEAIGYLGK